MSASRHDHWDDHPDSVLAGAQPENWRAPAQEPVFRYPLPVGSYVLTLTSTMSRRRSVARCAGLTRGRPNGGLAGDHPGALPGRRTFFNLSNNGKYSWSLAFVVWFRGLLFLEASGGFFRACVRSCPFAFRVHRCLFSSSCSVDFAYSHPPET